MQRVIENGGEGGFCAWEMEELLHLGDGGAQVSWRDGRVQVAWEMEERRSPGRWRRGLRS